MVLATGVDLPENPEAIWSTFAKPTETVWPFLLFKEQLLDYLSRNTDRVFNHTTNEDIFVTLPATPEERLFLLRAPPLRQLRKPLAPNLTALNITEADVPGQYELTNVGQGTVQAFSVNPSAAESDLTRLTEAQLTALAGPNRIQVARSIDELKADINVADLGKEVTSIAMLALIVLFCGEHLVANYFYDVESSENEKTIGNVARPSSPI